MSNFEKERNGRSHSHSPSLVLIQLVVTYGC
jgi:hypothetical protein